MVMIYLVVPCPHIYKNSNFLSDRQFVLLLFTRKTYELDLGSCEIAFVIPQRRELYIIFISSIFIHIGKRAILLLIMMKMYLVDGKFENIFVYGLSNINIENFL